MAFYKRRSMKAFTEADGKQLIVKPKIKRKIKMKNYATVSKFKKKK